MKTMVSRRLGPLATADVEEVLRRSRPLSERETAALYRLYAGPLTAYASRTGAADPEAAANSALFDVFRAHARNPIVDEPAFRAYAYRAARNHTINQGRRRRPEPVAPETIEAVQDAPVQQVVDRMWLDDILDQLTEDQADVLRMRLVEGLTAEEVGVRLGRRTNAVYQLQHRAENKLRRVAFAALVAAIGIAGLLAMLARQSPVVIEPSPANESEDQVTTIPTTTPPNTVVGLAGVESTDESLQVVIPPAADEPTSSTPETVEPGPEPEPEPGPPTTPEVDEAIAEAAVPNEAAETDETTAVSASFNVCNVRDNGSLVWIELFDQSLLSDPKAGPFVPPASVSVTGIDADGGRFEADSTSGSKLRWATGWSEAGQLMFASEPTSGESRWIMHVGEPGIQIESVSYRQTGDSELLPVAACSGLGA